MWKYDIEYAGEMAREHYLKIVERPNIPAPVIRNTGISVPGRDGLLYSREDVAEDIAIQIEMNYFGEPQEWFEYMRRAKAWLLQPGNHELKFEDDPEYFYRVKKVELSETERNSRKIGRFKATFYCYGYQYLEAGKEEHSINEVMRNIYHESHPVYCIKGEGVCSIKVNGNVMQVKNIGQNITIDTELMIAYREDGEIVNTSVTGNYEGLYLRQGDNEIEITEGFEMKIIPNWRCL